MKRFFFIALTFVSLYSCKRDQANDILSDLELYVEENSDLTTDFLIACATGDTSTFGNESSPISVFYYPISGSSDPHLFISKVGISDSSDISQYSEQTYPSLDVLNGKLKRYTCPNLSDVWAIVTYNSPGKVHISDPVKIKYHSNPTAFIDSIVNINEVGVNPEFSWISESEPNNVIYFEVVSDTLGNIISGTYTIDKFWDFYDTSNVVLNIHETVPAPFLAPNETYEFTLMGVSEDNWVYTAAIKRFNTF